jgi:NAD(P)-dependent dehydrogenase (short-subunit alcohol dehydrogenase family)
MTILITGGTKGIGLAVARRFARPGIDIFLNYHNDKTAADSAAAALRALGACPHPIRGDVSTPTGVGAVLREVGSVVASLDLIVHCAVRVLVGPLLSLDPIAFGEAIALNGASLVYLVQAARPLLAVAR